VWKLGTVIVYLDFKDRQTPSGFVLFCLEILGFV
jgi:hypothetical protein